METANFIFSLLCNILCLLSSLYVLSRYNIIYRTLQSIIDSNCMPFYDLDERIKVEDLDR